MTTPFIFLIIAGTIGAAIGLAISRRRRRKRGKLIEQERE
jgi:LPXTG-motif cell wall-anchored protein